MKSTEKHGRIFRWSAFVSSCLALMAFVMACAPDSGLSVRPGRTTGTGTAEPSVTSTAALTTGAPDYFRPYDEPSLEEIYQIEPFARLFPKSGFNKLQFSSSYRGLPDQFLPDALYLKATFQVPSDSSESLTVYIDRSDDRKPEQIYDPERNYIGPDKLIPAKYLTKEVVDQLYCKVSDPKLNYRYSFRIFLLCELDGKKYEVEYEYYGNGFTPEMLYELITSAPCFDSIKSTE